MKKLYDLCVVTSKYTQNGQQKSRYENIGTILEKEDGKPFMMLKAHFNPAAITRQEGSENIFVSMFSPKDKDSNNNNNSQQQKGSSQNAGYDVEDEAAIPF